MSATASAQYARRLSRLSGARWKKFLHVQAPYAANIRRVCRGSVLDVGCGIGRNLVHLQGRGTGVDHNAASVLIAQSRGLKALTAEEFLQQNHPGDLHWDTLLISHVLEHLSQSEIEHLMATYLPFLAPTGRLVMICPQEWAYARDATHVQFLDLTDLGGIAARHSFKVSSAYSFPWPRQLGRWVPHSEFVVVADRGLLRD